MIERYQKYFSLDELKSMENFVDFCTALKRNHSYNKKEWFDFPEERVIDGLFIAMGRTGKQKKNAVKYMIRKGLI